MLKGKTNFKAMVETNFDFQWIIDKTKTITSGIDTKTNLRVSLQNAMLTFLTICQYSYEANTAYLARFKSASESLVIIAGENILLVKR